MPVHYVFIVFNSVSRQTYGNSPSSHTKRRRVVRLVALSLYSRQALHDLLGGPHILDSRKTEQPLAPHREQNPDPSTDQPVVQSLNLHLPRHSGSVLAHNSIKFYLSPRNTMDIASTQLPHPLGLRASRVRNQEQTATEITHPSVHVTIICQVKKD